MLVTTETPDLRKRLIGGFIVFLLVIGFLIFRLFPTADASMDLDHWADNLKVPSDIYTEHPLNLTEEDKRPAKMQSVTKTKPDLQLYNAFQPGLYEYDFWMGKCEKGTVYLKAFEITKGTELSSGRLPARSSVKIFNPNNQIKRFSSTVYFTIREGDWRKPYAARFEVWFKPDTKGQELKLLSKNYVIEGWQKHRESAN